MLERVTLNDYLTPAINGVGTTGAAVELNAALKVPQAGKTSIAVPWQVLELRQVIEPGQTEQRAFTTTTSYGGGVMQRPILQRLFGPGIMDLLGVRIDSVPAGRTEWPLITGGAARSGNYNGRMGPGQRKRTTKRLDAKPFQGIASGYTR